MTSSFGNVIGTPRDQLPDISKTNYIATEPDLAEAVNDQIDDNIKDTKEFFDDMIKIEEQRIKNRDKRFSSLTSLIGDTAKITQSVQAERANRELDDLNFQRDAQTIKELQEAETTNDYMLIQMYNELGQDDARVPLVQEALEEIVNNVNPDSSLNQFLMGYDKILNTSIDSVLGSLGHDKMATGREAVNARRFAERLVRTKIHIDALNRGYDIDSGRYKKQFLKRVQPNIDSYIQARSYKWDFTLAENRKKIMKEEWDEKIIDVAESINKTPAQGQNLSIFTNPKTGLVRQIADLYFPGQKNAMTKAVEYVGDTWASAIENGTLSPANGTALLSQLPYSDPNRKIDFKSINAYAASLDVNSKEFLRISNLINSIEDAVQKKQTEVRTDKENKYQNLLDKEEDRYNALISAKGKPLTSPEYYQFYSEFTGNEALYVEGHTLKGKIPDWLLTGNNQLISGGTGTALKVFKYADLINSQSNIVNEIVAKKLNKTFNQFTVDDLLFRDKAADEFRTMVISKMSGKDSDFEIFLSGGKTEKDFIAQQVKEWAEKLEAGEYDGFNTVTNMKLAYQKEELKERYNKEGLSLVDSNQVHPGEELILEQGLAHIRSGGRRFPNVHDWYKNFNVIDDDGYTLKPREFLFRRLTALGAFKDDPVYGKFIPKSFKITPPALYNYEANNGIQGTITIMNIGSKDGEEGEYARAILDSFETKEAAKGNAIGRTGYDYFDTNSLKSAKIEGLLNLPSQPYNIESSLTTRKLTDMNMGLVRQIAKNNPDIVLGRYGMTGRQLTAILDQRNFVVDRDQKLDANYQDYLSFEIMRYNLSRGQAIRGMSVKGGKFVTQSTHFSKLENDALREVFPKLSKFSMLQLKNLSSEINDLILTELEKAQKEGPDAVKEFKEKQKEERRKRRQAESKRQITEGDVFTP